MSEKFDGVRACWDGRVLLSKSGSEIQAPEWFVGHLPRDVHLDGELWMGRGAFERLLSTIGTPLSVDWKLVKYMVFDLPKPDKPVEGRLEELEALALPPHCTAVQREPCAGNQHLMELLEDLVVEKDGEGFMLSMPHSLYVGGRTDTLLKVKVDVVVFSGTSCTAAARSKCSRYWALAFTACSKSLEGDKAPQAEWERSLRWMCCAGFGQASPNRLGNHCATQWPLSERNLEASLFLATTGRLGLGPNVPTPETLGTSFG